MVLFFGSQVPSLRNVVPFCKASATARPRCVLRDENGMALEWRLLAVLEGRGRSQAFSDQAASVSNHRLKTARGEVITLAAAQLHPLPERGFLQRIEQLVEVPHYCYRRVIGSRNEIQQTAGHEHHLPRLSVHETRYGWIGER